jgi:hypothetical protein
MKRPLLALFALAAALSFAVPQVTHAQAAKPTPAPAAPVPGASTS